MRKILLMVGLFLNSFAFCQVAEDFSDGEVLHHPQWLKDTGRFFVNTQLQLQSKLINKSDTAFLSTPNNYLLNTTWEFYVQINTDPSTSNQMRVYLSFDNANLDSAGNGYFIQIGETGNSDSYDLYKKTGKSISKIIDGPARYRSSLDTIKVWFYVIHRIDGYWELYSRTNPNQVWQSEGSCFDRTFRKSTFMGISLKHTSTRSDKFIFDELKIYPFELDTSAPEYNDIEIRDTIISLLFSEEIDSTGFNQPNKYYLNQSINPKKVLIDPVNPSLVHLYFSQSIKGGRLNLIVPPLSDLLGNKNDSSYRINYNYIAPINNKRNDVFISEIMADPSPSIGLPESEYIEWYNASGRDLYIENWLFINGNSQLKLKPYLFKADSFIIFCKNADTSLFKPFGNTIGLSSWPSVGNTSGQLKIIDHKGLLIDEVNYHHSWYKNNNKNSGGYSLECNQSHKTCEGVYVWEASKLGIGGSPGKRNSFWNVQNQNPLFIYQFDFLTDSSIYIRFSQSTDSVQSQLKSNYLINNLNLNPHKINALNNYYSEYILIFKEKFKNNKPYKFTLKNISTCDGILLEEPAFTIVFRNNDDTSIVKINELMIDPSPKIGLAEVEYIELFNSTNNYINLSSYTVSIGSTKLILPAYLLKPSEYILLCASSDTNDLKMYGKYIDFPNFPSLSNTASTITIQNKAGRILDKISYKNSWYRDVTKMDGGWSLELIDPYSRCNTINRWAASINKSGGTPGKTNSIADFFADKKDLSVKSFKNYRNKQFSISFSKPVIGQLINPAQLYFVGPRNSLHFPNKVVLDSPYYEKASLNFNKALLSGSYNLVCQYIPSCGRNDTNIIFPVKLFIDEKDEDDYIISELMADPSPSNGLPECEYIELFNKSEDDLLDCSFYIADTKDTILVNIPSWPAKSYVLLCEKSFRNVWPEETHVIPHNKLPSLDNEKDTLSILSMNLSIIDKINYSLAQMPIEKRDGGYSYIKLNDTWDCIAESSWQASKNNLGGSPGMQNESKEQYQFEPIKIVSYEFINDHRVLIRLSESPEPNQEFHVYNELNQQLSVEVLKTNEIIFSNPINLKEGEISRLRIYSVNCMHQELDTILTIYKDYIPHKSDVIISEILFNPLPNCFDFLELYNNTEKVINIEDLIIADQKDTIHLKDYISTDNPFKYIQAKEYRALSLNVEDIKNNYFVAKKDHLIGSKKMLPMADEEGALMILNSSMELLDQVYYSKNMHYSWLDNVEGRSLERKRLNTSGLDENNWASASDNIGKASPTGQNSQFTREEQTSTKKFWLSSMILKPKTNGANSAMEINYKIEGETVFMNVKVFSASGAFISEVMQGLSIRNSGMVKWDLTSNKELVPSGTYILSIECYSENGKNQHYKLPFAVHY